MHYIASCAGCIVVMSIYNIYNIPFDSNIIEHRNN